MQNFALHLLGAPPPTVPHACPRSCYFIPPLNGRSLLVSTRNANLRRGGSQTLYYLKPSPPDRAARDERWRELCALAAVEKDPEKLQGLIAEILELFDPGGEFRRKSA